MSVIPFPIQYALFQGITRKFKKRSMALADYLQRFPGVSESTARARFSGTTGITYDHGMEIAMSYQLRDQHICPDGWPANELLLTVTSVQPDIGAFLDMLLRDFSPIPNLSRPRILLVMEDVPFFLLKKHRRLAGLLLYFNLCFEAGVPYYRKFRFGPRFMNEPHVHHWLDQGRAILDIYQQIEGVEYWSPHMLDRFLRKVRLVTEHDLFEDPAVLAEIKEEIGHFIGDLERVLETGQKNYGLQPHLAAKVQIHNHRGFAPGNLMAAQANGDDLFVYHEPQLFNGYRYGAGTMALFQQKIDYLANVSPIVPHSGKQKTDFVAALEQHADILLNVLK